MGLRLSLLKTPTPYHLLLCSTLLGTQLYQTFVITKVTFNNLPLGVFVNLNKKTFPTYFKLQTALVVSTILSYPPAPLLSLAPAAPAKVWKGEGVLLSEVAFLGTVLATAGLNLVIYGPRTQSAMVERSHEETREAVRVKADRGAGRAGARPEVAVSDELHAARRYFSRSHAMSIHLNLIAILATLGYALSIAGRLEAA